MVRTALILTLASGLVGAQTGAPGQRTVGRYPDGRPILMASLNGANSQAYVEGLLVRSAGSAGLAVGIERPRDVGVVTAARRDPVLLSGQTVDDALAAIVGAESALTSPGGKRTHAPYRVTWTRGFAHISAFRGKPTVLDMVVTSFKVRNVRLGDAVGELRRRLLGGAPPPKTMDPSQMNRPDQLLNFAERPVTVSFSRAPAREILDALVSVGGGVSWIVRYGADPLDPKTTVIILMSFDGKGLQVN